MAKTKSQIAPAEEETKVLTPDVTSVEAATTNTTSKVTPAKTTTRKTKSETTKKTTSRSKVAKEPIIKEVVKVITPQVFFQFCGNEYDANAILEQAKIAWVQDGHLEADIKSIKLYIKPEEAAAYYVINETETGKIDL